MVSKIAKISSILALIIVLTPIIVLSQAPSKDIPSLCVSGIMFDQENSMAVVNAVIVRVGEFIEGVKVLRISDSAVLFEYKGNVFSKDISSDCGETGTSITKTSLSGFFQSDKRKTQKPLRMQRDKKSKFNFIGSITLDSLDRRGIVLASIILLLIIVIYAYYAVALQKIAAKTEVGNGWMAWIPIVNLHLMCKIADKPGWWLILLFVPYLNIIIMIIVGVGMARARGKPAWLGVLMVIPIANLAAIGYLAFSN